MIFIINLKNKMSYSKQISLIEMLPSANLECYVAPIVPNHSINNSWNLVSQNVSVPERAVGEVQPHVLKHFGVNYALVGHLERRLYLNEELSIVKRKLLNVLTNGLTPVLVLGFEKNLECIKELDYLLEGVSLTNKRIIFACESLKSTITGNKNYTIQDTREVYLKFRQKIKQYICKNFNFTYNIILGGGIELEDLEEIMTIGYDGILLGDRYVDIVTIK